MSIYRNKASMVVYQLEQELGQFVANKTSCISQLPNNLVENVDKRSKNEELSYKIPELIEKTYISEVFAFAEHCVRGTQDESTLKELRKLVSDLDLYAIRNAIAHPNQKFYDFYWYRVATIASDPITMKLGLIETRQALDNAENNRIVTPPDEWLNKKFFEIPNNLPETLDHDLTGLIGRQNELKNIKKLILNPRNNLIAITGPGGIGKTAVTLEAMKDICLIPSVESKIEGIMFASMKTEALTVDGVKSLNASETLSELKNEIIEKICQINNDEIYDCIEDIIELYGNNHIILFIDNLETLIRDNSQDFEDFIATLPLKWKIVVTSRIPMNSATNHPLPQMDKKHASILTRSYSTRRNLSLDEGKIQKIADTFYGNPLAIRLSVDALHAGKAYREIFTDVSTDLSHFSYKNLIDVLSDNDMHVLEALLIKDKSSRNDIADLLDKNLDDVSKGLLKLRTTSLVSSSNTDDVDFYTINAGVRNLLVTNPRNVKIRGDIQEKIKQNVININKLENELSSDEHNPYSLWYIPKNTPSQLKTLLLQGTKFIKNSRKRPSATDNQLYEKFMQRKELYKGHSSYWILLAMLNQKLKLIPAAKECVMQAKELGAKSLVVNHVLAGIAFYEEAQYSDAEDYLSEFIYDQDTFNPSIIGRNNYLSILRLHLKSLSYQQKPETIIENAHLWESHSESYTMVVDFVIKALKMKSEKLQSNEKTTLLKEAIDKANHAINHGDIPKSGCQVLYNEILFILQGKYEIDKSTLSHFLEFMFHCIEWLDLPNSKIIEDYSLLSNVDCNNPFKESSMNLYFETIASKEFDISSIEHNDSYIEVSVYNIPQSSDQYVFAEDINKKQYLVHYNDSQNFEWLDWSMVTQGSKFLVKEDTFNKRKHGATAKCSEVYLKHL